MARYKLTPKQAPIYPAESSQTLNRQDRATPARQCFRECLWVHYSPFATVTVYPAEKELDLSWWPISSSQHGFPLQQPTAPQPCPDPTPTWASCSSASSDVDPLAWALPLGSLVSIRAGELGLEDAGAPFGRACHRKESSSGPRNTTYPSLWLFYYCSRNFLLHL